MGGGAIAPYASPVKELVKQVWASRVAQIPRVGLYQYRYEYRVYRLDDSRHQRRYFGLKNYD